MATVMKRVGTLLKKYERKDLTCALIALCPCLCSF